MPNGGLLENEKWQRMIDDVLVDPVRRNRFSAELQRPIGELSTAGAFTLELAESGDPITPHDEVALGALDRRDPALMRSFRDMLVHVLANAADVNQIGFQFDYSTIPPQRVTITATMTRGMIACALTFPNPNAVPRPSAMPRASASP